MLLNVRPTIFVLSNMRHFGGAERSIGALLPHLTTSVAVRIYVENEQHLAHLGALRLPGLEIVRLRPGNSLPAFVAKLVTLSRDILARDPEALLANGHKGALLLALLARLLFWKRLRVAVYIRDFDYYLLPFILRALPRAAYFAPTQAIFESPRYLRAGLLHARCDVIPNAVEPARSFEPANDSFPPAATESSAGDLPFFACCARITPWKGIDYLLRAFRLIADDFPQTQLRVYGEPIDPVYYQALQALVKELHLGSQVRFEPFAAEMVPVYQHGLFFVIPSLSTKPGPESFCRIIIEAWSFRKPVIAFAAGGPRYLIRDREDGLLVEERNLPALAQAIRTLLADPTFREQLGAAGHGRIATEFHATTISSCLLHRLLGPEIPASPVATSAQAAPA